MQSKGSFRPFQSENITDLDRDRHSETLSIGANPVPQVVPNTLQLNGDIDLPQRRLEGLSQTDCLAQPMDPTN
jgi:hypothetical protein